MALKDAGDGPPSGHGCTCAPSCSSASQKSHGAEAGTRCACRESGLEHMGGMDARRRMPPAFGGVLAAEDAIWRKQVRTAPRSVTVRPYGTAGWAADGSAAWLDDYDCCNKVVPLYFAVARGSFYVRCWTSWRGRLLARCHAAWFHHAESPWRHGAYLHRQLDVGNVPGLQGIRVKGGKEHLQRKGRGESKGKDGGEGGSDVEGRVLPAGRQQGDGKTGPQYACNPQLRHLADLHRTICDVVETKKRRPLGDLPTTPDPALAAVPDIYTSRNYTEREHFELLPSFKRYFLLVDTLDVNVEGLVLVRTGGKLRDGDDEAGWVHEIDDGSHKTLSWWRGPVHQVLELLLRETGLPPSAYPDIMLNACSW